MAATMSFVKRGDVSDTKAPSAAAGVVVDDTDNGCTSTLVGGALRFLDCCGDVFDLFTLAIFNLDTDPLRLVFLGCGEGVTG